MVPTTARVVIIGAGPAGLSAAAALAERGFTQVTVLEREARVGGKCKAFRYEGHVYDLGANLTTPRYEHIRALADRLGMTLRKVQERRIVNVGTETFASLAEANVLERLVVRGGVSFYTQMRALTGIDRAGYVGLRENVEQPFNDWLQRHGLGMFRELFEVLFVAYGYGGLGELPAAYALKFFDSVHIQASVDVVLGQDVPFTMDFAEGFQELWERVVAEYRLQVTLGAEVRSIVRSADGVEVRYTVAGEERVERYDVLVLACPLQDTPTFLDCSAHEARLFSHIRTNEYYTTIARVSRIPETSTYVYPYARRLTPGQPTVFYPPVPDDDGVFVFYAYGGPGIDVPTVRLNIARAIHSLGGRVQEFLHTERWRYFPHVESEVMRGGFYDELDGLQGQNRTYYAGELLSFTLVELVWEHTRALVDRYFA
jgi:protoporphyrinogen/coproporphyrinogen III oxidase